MPVEPSAGASPTVVQRALAIGYRALLLALVVGASVHALSAVWHFTIDDAGISYAYARHIAEGEGPVAVIGGPWIEGYSNPLWVLVLALLHVVGLPLLAGAKLLGALFFGAGVALGMAWLCRVDGRSWRSFGAVEAGFAVAIAVCAELVVWVPAGLENALFMALLLGMLWLDAREAQQPDAFGASGLCAFGLSITRPEAVMYAAPLLAIKLVRAWQGREPMRQVGQALLLFAVPFAVYHLGHYLVFGELVPNTYYAKPSGRGGSDYLESTARESGLVYLLPLALVGLFGKPRWVLLPGWACVAGSAFVLYSGGDWMPHARFLSLFGACVVLLAARGVSQIGRLLVRLTTWGGRVRLPGEAASFVLSLAALAAWGSYQMPRLASIRQKNWCHLCERLADTRRLQRLARQARLPSHSLVTQDFGGPAWLSDESFYPIDFLGLCDRSVVLIRGKRARGGVRDELRFYQYLIHEQPTPPSWVVVPPNFWPGFDRSLEYRDYYRLDPRLLPRTRRDSFFVLHRGELADYFPPVPPAPWKPVGDLLSVAGWRVFAHPAAAAAEAGPARLVPGARVLVIVSVVPGSLRGAERVVLEISAGEATASSEALELDRGIKGLTKQFVPGEPLSLELPLTLPAAPAGTYELRLRVLPGSPGSSSTGSVPLIAALGELEPGGELPRFERVLPRYPAALPAALEPALRALRPAVTTIVEHDRRAGRAASRDDELSRRLAALAGELEARGSSEQAYLAAVWATQVDRSAWVTLADTVHRLRPAAMDDEHTLELALLRSYYSSASASDLSRLVAFYLAGRRTFEADYFLQRWASTATGVHEPSLHAALDAERRAQLSDDLSGADRVLGQVAFDPLGGAADFEQAALDAWQGDLGVFQAGPGQRAKGLRGQHGAGLLTSGHAGDSATGVLTSREFPIAGRALSLLVGGGTAARRVGVELWVEGEKQLTAAGDDSDNLRAVFWNVERFQGKPARLRVVDRASRRHVLLDRVLLWR